MLPDGGSNLVCSMKLAGGLTSTSSCFILSLLMAELSELLSSCLSKDFKMSVINNFNQVFSVANAALQVVTRATYEASRQFYDWFNADLSLCEKDRCDVLWPLRCRVLDHKLFLDSTESNLFSRISFHMDYF